MLDLRPSCENCDKALPPKSTEAMICTFECTFCKDCVDHILQNVCPNCSGGFTNRPIRPASLLSKYPASKNKVHKPIDEEKFKKLFNEKVGIKPENR